MFDHKFQTLVTVCETGSFTKAAKQLSLTQPAVSNQMKLIENELNIKLFFRDNGNLRLTSEGEIVAKYARRSMGLYEKMNTAILDEKTHSTHISVGITHTAESNRIAEVLARYCEQHHEIKLTLIADSIHNIYDRIKTYDISFAIVDGHLENSSCNSILLDTDALVLAVSNDSPLAGKSLVTIDELKNERMILRLPDSGTSNLFVSRLENLNLSIDDFNIYLQVDNIATIKDLIRGGFGVSVLAQSACMDEVRKGKMTILPIENLSMIRETNIIYPVDFEHIGLLQDIVKIYRRIEGQNRKEGRA
ncbi:MAG: LysR family transcriptional regulator [Lachnospiraceae bacterium]|nr:LysR family transcriptional regulator [Lachnospiraceae bacterium]